MAQKSKSWRDLSIERIQVALFLYETDCKLKQQGMEPKSARAFVNKHYPFSQRQYSPYQIWLEELKQLERFVATGKPVASYQHWRYGFKIQRKKTAVDPTAVLPGLLHLLES